MSSSPSILRGPSISGEHFKLRGPRRTAKPPLEESAPGAVAPVSASGEAAAEGEHRPHGFPGGDRDAGFQAGHDAGYEEGYQKGHDTGYAEGQEAGMRSGDAEGREAYTAGLRQLEELTQSLNRTVELGLNEAEDMMVAIVFESVCKIVGDTLATREGVEAVVREALGRTRGKSALVIRVNPLDLELIEEGAAFGIASETDWRADEAIPMGGCIVESEYGTLDARIDTQLNQLKRTLLAARHKPAETAGSD